MTACVDGIERKRFAARDVLHNPREDVMVRIGMGRKVSFLTNSRAIGEKSNAADRPSGAGLTAVHAIAQQTGSAQTLAALRHA